MSCGIPSASLKRVFVTWGISTASTVCSPEQKFGEMVKEFEGRDVCIKRIWVHELLVPRLVDDFHDEVLAGRIGRFVERMVILLGFMFTLGLVKFSSRRVLVNCVVVECDDWRD